MSDSSATYILYNPQRTAEHMASDGLCGDRSHKLIRKINECDQEKVLVIDMKDPSYSVIHRRVARPSHLGRLTVVQKATNVSAQLLQEQLKFDEIYEVKRASGLSEQDAEKLALAEVKAQRKNSTTTPSTDPTTESNGPHASITSASTIHPTPPPSIKATATVAGWSSTQLGEKTVTKPEPTAREVAQTVVEPAHKEMAGVIAGCATEKDWQLVDGIEEWTCFQSSRRRRVASQHSSWADGY